MQNVDDRQGPKIKEGTDSVRRRLAGGEPSAADATTSWTYLLGIKTHTLQVFKSGIHGETKKKSQLTKNMEASQRYDRKVG